MTEVEKKIINRVQKNFDICERPFQSMGMELGVDEEEVLKVLQRFKAEGVIRQISGIFDTRSLGYESSLVAAKVASEKCDEAAAILNTHPGVSHNYARDHEFNLWYTVAVPPDSLLGLKKTIELFHELCGAESTRPMPTLKLYKIGLNLDMGGQTEPKGKSESASYNHQNCSPEDRLNETEIQFVQEVQKDLSIQSTPFTEVAEKLGLSFEELAEMGKDLTQRGKLRRFSAVLHHRKAGFTANAMGVWNVKPEDCDTVGVKMASFRAVSHCYRRPAYPDWPYSIFTMVHGKSGQECDFILKTISEETGIADYGALYSTKEYKKMRVRYFTPEVYEWEKKYIKK